ncbi:probable ATP-dependent RNA helicase DDX60 [Amphiura filiformis]|uniref:probable ATP-dependent RNA helicase DDX60 n=1 Tax=Amphiura filiformis TaxID=82378 RepID=UPI003B215CFB
MAEGGDPAKYAASVGNESTSEEEDSDDVSDEYDSDDDIQRRRRDDSDSDSDDYEERLNKKILAPLNNAENESDCECSDDEDDNADENDKEVPKRRVISSENLFSYFCDMLYFYAPRTHLNLMHDFTESDLFTIDGDSILADIFAQYGLDLSHGGQLLHLVYLVELFFKDFKEREGQFHIVFFKETETIWHHNALKLLARRIIIKHLAHNTNCHLVTHIPHPFSKEWKEYIDHYRPAFVMLSDGESLPQHSPFQSLVRGLLMSCLILDLDCAFCSPLERSLRSVNTFYIEARKAPPGIRADFQRSGMFSVYKRKTQKLRLPHAEGYADSEVEQVCSRLLSAIEKHGNNRHLISSSRDVITIIACAEVMKECEADHGVTEKTKTLILGASRLFLLHTVLLQYLPLESRAQNTPDDETAEDESSPLHKLHRNMKVLLRKIHEAMAKLVGSYDQLCANLTDLNGIRETQSLADLMDGRLFFITIYLLQKYHENNIQVSYPDHVVCKFRFLWQVSYSLAFPDNANPVDDEELLRAPLHFYSSTQKELASEHSSDNIKKAFIPLTSQLVTDYAGGLVTELASDSAMEVTAAAALKRKTFRENYHWHTGQPLKDDYENTKEDRVDKMPRWVTDTLMLDLLKELGTEGLHQVYTALGLRKHEIEEAESHEFNNEWRVKKVFRFWKAKEGFAADVDALFAALEECELTEVKEKLQAKWNSKGLSHDKWARRKQLKDKQLFARFQRNYGESLEGKAHGFKQITIIVDKNSSAKRKPGKGGHQGQKNKQGLSNKEKIRQANEQKDKEKADADAEASWAATLSGIKADLSKNIKSRFKVALKKFDDYIDHCNSDKWRVQAMLGKMECYWLAWKEVNSVRKGNKIEPSLFSDVTDEHPMYYAIMLFVCCQEILDHKATILTKKQLKMIAAYLRGLGFNSLADVAEHTEDKEDRKPVSQKGSLKPLFSFKLPVPDECSIDMTSTRFQLQFVGQWLKRDERTDKDPRVEDFIPDTWQRELLDIVDKNASALIVAPTSSGKTYASYYCMEKVLRRSDEGVVVYVSPTKALMNQVAATVYARFNKPQLPSGKVVCGMFSRDFRRNALTCQVLVTVPQCLEILLLSPCRQEWAKKIEYVIFDEVHCLGGEIGAEVWEHLLVAINCPFLALSATIRNPEHIRGWLQASQDFKRQQAQQVASGGAKKKTKKQPTDRTEMNAYKVGLVVWKERHSDLEKFVYLPNPKPEDVILPNNPILSDTSEFVPLHPVACLDINKMKSQGLPADLTLSPREALVLFNTMQDVYPDCQHLKALDPEVYFKKTPILQKQDARDYERALKKELMRWMQKEQDGETKVSAVITKLKLGLDEKEQAWKKQWETQKKQPRGGLFSNPMALHSFDKLIRQLHAQKKLPAIVFSQNRVFCQALAVQIARILTDCEDKQRDEFKNSEEGKTAQKMMARYDKTMKRIKDAETEGTESVDLSDKLRDEFKHSEEGKTTQKMMARYDKTMKKRIKDAETEDGVTQSKRRLSKKNEETLLLVTESLGSVATRDFLSNAPLPNCTLREAGKPTDEMEKILNNLPYYSRSSGHLRYLIERGVAYHHAGLNAKQRNTVETLFRLKYIKVVTATSTLALGIHMPCKTVVFACEDLWLKPLSFRQMSGRSGRRGFDLVGNVIFFCVPPQKVQHLITSGLPQLRGHFPFSVSFVLRLMVLTHNSNDQRDAHEKVLALLNHPFVCHNAKDMEEVVKHFFLFSVNYLIHVGLLEPDGTPIGLSGLATHLHYHEPANLAFVSMLQEGAFHDLCKRSKDGTFSKSVMETLVLVLAHMFGRILEPMAMVKTIEEEGVHSKVVFKDSLLMPEPFSSILKKHNEDASEVFRGYVHIVCDYAARRDDAVKQNKLPLSKVAIQPPAVQTTSSDNPGDLMADMKVSSNKSTTLSPFVMTSGHKDENLHMFDADIKQAIGQGVHIEHSKIPTLKPAEDLKDIRGKKVYINAYAYDFFKHGSQKLIERENRLQSGDVYNKLNDFRLVVASISVALAELGPEEDDVVLAFKQLKKEYNAKFGDEFRGGSRNF